MPGGHNTNSTPAQSFGTLWAISEAVYKMKQLLLIFFLLFATLLSRGQRDCNLSSLPKESKDELFSFWKILNESLQQKDSSKLISLCDFPFFVSQDLFSHDPSDKGKHFDFDSSNIRKYVGSLFFENYFGLAIASCTDPTKCMVFHGNYNKKHKTCGYVFCYLFKNNNGNNEERCFSIVRIDNSYKLTGSWVRSQ